MCVASYPHRKAGMVGPKETSSLLPKGMAFLLSGQLTNDYPWHPLTYQGPYWPPDCFIIISTSYKKKKKTLKETAIQDRG